MICTNENQMLSALETGEKIEIPNELREEIIDKANYMGEGLFNRDELSAMNNEQLVDSWKEAVYEFARGHGY